MTHQPFSGGHMAQNHRSASSQSPTFRRLYLWTLGALMGLGVAALIGGCQSTEFVDPGPSDASIRSDSLEVYPYCEAADDSLCGERVDGEHTYGFRFAADCAEACQCVRRCEVDSDCAPSGAAAEAQCWAQTCVLNCERTDDCPDSMECVLDPSRAHTWCMHVRMESPCPERPVP